MKIASVADVKANLSAYIKASEDELVVITKNGKPVAVLVPMEDDDELERFALAYSRRFQAILGQARDQLQARGGIPHDDFWREVDAKPDEPPSAQNNAV
jgi:prevent-host-death family protein